MDGDFKHYREHFEPESFPTPISHAKLTCDFANTENTPINEECMLYFMYEASQETTSSYPYIGSLSKCNIIRDASVRDNNEIAQCGTGLKDLHTGLPIKECSSSGIVPISSNIRAHCFRSIFDRDHQ